MFDHRHYVPILRWKAGEKRALKGLLPRDKAGMTPLFEWSRAGEVSPEEDRVTPVPTPRELDADILKHWGARPFFCDSHRFCSDHLGSDLIALRRFATELANGGLRPIPVLGLGDGVE